MTLAKNEFPGIAAERVALLFDCFAALGTLKGFGQTQLAAEMKVRPQLLRRRAADARHDRSNRGMPIDQLKLIAAISVREIEPLRGVTAQQLTAWMLGLDDLLDKNFEPALRSWHARTDPRGSTNQPEEKPKKKRKK